MTEAFFFDTYALIEIIQGNPSYKHYIDAEIILTQLNLFELYFILRRDIDEFTAKKALTEYLPFATEYDTRIIESAAALKLAYAKRKLSMTDCIGYVLAEQFGVRFLTGDRQFEDLPNVEYVK